MNTIYQEDAIQWLRQLADASVDLMITDPPYESLEKHRAIGTTTRLKHSKSSNNAWFSILPNDQFHALLTEIYRVMKPNTHFYLFCDQETMFIVKPIAEQVGFRFWKPLIWDKCAIGMGYHYRARYEMILFFEKGKRKLNNFSIPDVLSYKRVWRGYPTEKPVPLLEVLIEQSSQQGELIVDPFFGSGSTLIAAKNCQRNFSGSDISPDAHAHCSQRLTEWRLPEKE